MSTFKNLTELTTTDFKCHLDKPTFFIKSGKNTRTFLNCPFAIDIETTSTIDDNGNEIAFPYCYQVGVNNECYITRDYKVFYRKMEEVKQWLENTNQYIHCCIHNLPYEFTFFSGFMAFTDVFAKSNGKPLVCYYGNIRFIDTYQISGLSLAKLAKNYCKTQKIKDIDYKQYRVPETPLTESELRYCCDDVKILNEYWNTDEIQRYIKKKGATKLPLTATAKVRMLLEDNAPKRDREKIREFLYMLYPTEEIFDLLSLAFMGGVVKSNPRYTNIELHNLGCVDLASSYPDSLFTRMFPISQFIKCDVKSLDDLTNEYCYLIQAKIKNIRSKFPIRTLSLSKVKNCKNARLDNGRIINADYLEITFTDIDFKYLFKFYDFDYEITKCYMAKAGRLPKYFMKTLIYLYQRKNELKPIYSQNPELKAEYLHVKGLLNSTYGCCVTQEKPFNFTFINGQWTIKQNAKYHKFNKRSLLTFAWGVWCSAWSRASLYDGLLICGDDIVYSDTDSCKFLNKEKHIKQFEEYNRKHDRLVKSACCHYGVAFDVMKGIGRYDFEPDVETFKTLGCKRYYHDEHVTISGISDKAFTAYAESIGCSVLDLFKDGVKIPPEHTMKNTSKYYINRHEPYIYKYTYDGIEHELPIVNYIYMCDAPWQMNLSSDYRNLLLLLLKERNEQNE